jgi:hypothetical protein
MIVVGMNLLTMIFAAVGFAVVRGCNGFFEISSPHEVKAFLSLD